MSQDKHFDTVGDTTNIDWKASFTQYLKLLTVGYNAKKKYIYELIKHWDETLYPNTTTSLANSPNPADENPDSDEEEAMAALQEGREIPRSSSDDPGSSGADTASSGAQPEEGAGGSEAEAQDNPTASEGVDATSTTTSDA